METRKSLPKMRNIQNVAVSGPVSHSQIQELSGEKISTCFQCEKCTNGCPLTFAMDILPHRVMHSIQLGLADEVLNSDTIWVCASCETCTARCPNDIDIAHVMDTLRQMSTERGVKASQKQAPVFHNVFLSSIKRFGRLHEATMALEYALKSEGVKGVRKQSGLGLEMMRKGKIRLMPNLGGGNRVKDVFRRAERKKQR
ncbi:MAG: 4Fe-4S dicluster domain-containing protein [Chloroflexota bacterium]